VLDALAGAGFELIGEPFARNENKFFAADLACRSEFNTAPGLRPHLQIEMTFQAPALPPVERPIRSLVAQAQGKDPQVRAFACVDPRAGRSLRPIDELAQLIGQQRAHALPAARGHCPGFLQEAGRRVIGPARLPTMHRCP
jgi:hypothetical protein